MNYDMTLEDISEQLTQSNKSVRAPDSSATAGYEGTTSSDLLNDIGLAINRQGGQ